MPDTPAARQFSGWLTAFNLGDPMAYREFLERNFPARVGHFEQEMDFRRHTGGFDFRKAESSTPTTFSGLVQERNSDQFARFTIEVEATEPHRISTAGLNAIPRPPEFALPRLGESALVAALRAKLEADTGADRFAGAVLWTQGDRIVFSAAYGLADHDSKAANTLETRFRIGSMNKMFTAVAVLQLVEAGKIRLADSIGRYLTDYPNNDIATKVTIHELLTHTGGTGDIFGPEFKAHRAELRTLQDYVGLFGSRGPEFEPGSRHVYSNYGFILLGALVEKVSGESYYDYVRDRVYKPAGMVSTDSLPEDQAVSGRAIGYTTGLDGSLRPNVDTLPYRGTSAGGGYSTVADLQRFAIALVGHKLLDAQHTELLTRGKVETPLGVGVKYAYGFEDRTVQGVRSFGHGGGAPGMNGDLRVFPESGNVIVVLSNADPPAAARVANFITERLPGT